MADREGVALHDVVDVGRRALARCRVNGCTCRPVISVEFGEGNWWVNVTHQAECPHDAADEYVPNIQPDGSDGDG